MWNTDQLTTDPFFALRMPVPPSVNSEIRQAERL